MGSRCFEYVFVCVQASIDSAKVVMYFSRFLLVQNAHRGNKVEGMLMAGGRGDTNIEEGIERGSVVLSKRLKSKSTHNITGWWVLFIL